MKATPEPCAHEWSDWQHTFLGCTRTCKKCRMTYCDPNHCGQYEARTTSAKNGDE